MTATYKPSVPPLGFDSSADICAIAAANFSLSIFGLAEVVTNRCAANGREVDPTQTVLADRVT